MDRRVENESLGAFVALAHSDYLCFLVAITSSPPYCLVALHAIAIETASETVIQE